MRTYLRTTYFQRHRHLDFLNNWRSWNVLKETCYYMQESNNFLASVTEKELSAPQIKV